MGRTLIGGTAVVPTTSVVKTTSTDWQSRQTEGLPLKATWAHDGSGNQWYGCSVYDCYGNAVGGADGGKANSTTSYQFGNYADQNFSYSGDNTGGYSTAGQLSTQPFLSSYWVQANRNNTYLPMHGMLNVSPDGNFASIGAPSYSSNSHSGYFSYYITQVLPQGRRPRKYISISNNVIYVASSLLSFSNTKIDGMDWSTHPTITGASWYADWSATNSKFSWGGACYNERTNKLMLVHQVSSTATQRAILLTGGSGVLLTSPTVSLSDWFDAVKASTWTEFDLPYNGGTVAGTRYDKRVILGDNDKAMVLQTQSTSKMHGGLLDWNTGSEGAYDWVPTYISVSTGGFNADNSVYYSQRIQATWSNKWLYCFSGTYQEGGGLSGIVVSTEDPSRAFTATHGVNIGCSVLPHGEDAFQFASHDNTDGAGMYGGTINLASTSTTGTDATTFHLSTSNVPTAIANLGALPASTVATQYTNTPALYYSTNYSPWVTVNWWPRDGVMSYQPL